MAKLILLGALVSLSFATLLSSACATPSPAMGAWEDAQRADPAACEEPSADQQEAILAR